MTRIPEGEPMLGREFLEFAKRNAPVHLYIEEPGTQAVVFNSVVDLDPINDTLYWAGPIEVDLDDFFDDDPAILETDLGQARFYNPKA